MSNKRLGTYIPKVVSDRFLLLTVNFYDTNQKRFFTIAEIFLLNETRVYFFLDSKTDVHVDNNGKGSIISMKPVDRISIPFV